MDALYIQKRKKPLPGAGVVGNGGMGILVHSPNLSLGDRQT